MGTAVPDWADSELSESLARLVRAGEADAVEFMQIFPSQARDLAKEIAALAPSGGLILLGVRDDGTIVGLPDCNSAGGRDNLVQRIQGLLISPPVTSRVKFAVDGDLTCAAIEIPPHPQPLYYVDHRPYVRHHRESRPATPEEVIDRVLRGTGLAGLSVLSDEGQALASLNRTLTEMLVESDLMRDERRFLNPWLESFAGRCEGWSRSLRSHAHDLAAEPLLADRLRGLARVCDEVALKWLQLEFSQDDISRLRGALDEVKVDTLDSKPLSVGGRATAREDLRAAKNRLDDIIAQAEIRDGMQVPDTLREASVLGVEAYRIALYPVGFIRDQQLAQLRDHLRQLALIDTLDMCWDGGESVQRMLEVMKHARASLAAAVDAR